jgi:hypothetical protein
VANACRTCGHWPSLFDLESNTIENGAPAAEEDVYAAQTVEAEPIETEVYEPPDSIELEMPPDFDAENEEEYAPAKPPWQRFARLIVPVGVVLYLLISALANRGG